MKRKHITIIILQHNQSNYTLECLRSIKAWHNSYNTTYDILLIDNGSEEEHKVPIRKFQVEELPIEIIWNTDNLGFGPAMNQGMEHVLTTRGKNGYVMLLNNDAMVRPGCIYSMIQCAESDEKIAVVGAKVLKPNTNFVHHTGVTCQKNPKESNIVDRYIRTYTSNIPKYMYEERLWVNGCCMVIKNEIIEKHGVFDMEFAPAYFEEADYCIRLRQLGYRIVYNPMAEVYHHQRITASVVYGKTDLFYRHWNKLCDRHMAWWKNEMSNFDYEVLPRVNIIMPAYNAETTIADTIRSIQEQGYPNYKIIIVDDGSTDTTGEIIKHFQQEYKKIYDTRNSDDFGPCEIEREKGIMYVKIINSGQSMARNTGLAMIEPDCDYIAYCDADDIWEPDHLERLVMFLEKNKHYDMVCSEALPINENGNKMESYGIPKFEKGGEYTSRVFHGGNPVFISSVLHRVDILHKVGGFLPDLDCIEDWHMWWKMSRMGRCYYYPLQLMKYIVRDDGYAGKVSEEKKQLLNKIIQNDKSIDFKPINFQYYNVNKVMPMKPINEYFKTSLLNEIAQMSTEEKIKLKELLGL